MNTVRIMICGLGGQGILLAERIFSFGLASAGYDVKVSELHGLAQRGGSVCAEICYGDKVFSPIIEEGKANFILSFDYHETFQYLSKLQNNGNIIVKSTTVISFPAHFNTLCINNPSFNNISLLGILVKELNLQKLDWQSSIIHHVKERDFEKNLRSFNLGLNFSNN